MDVAPVRLHGALAMGHPADHGKGRVENGQAQDQEGHGKGDHRVELEQALNGHGGQDETQEGSARITHEHLGGVQVIGQEAHAGPHQGRHHDGHLGLGADQGDDQHRGGGNGRHAVGQAVQAVDQVHRVGDAHDPQHRNGHGQPVQHPVGIGGKNVGVGQGLNGHAVQGRDQGRHDLHHKFQLGGQGHDVIHHAQHHDDDCPQQDALHLGIQPDIHEQQDAGHESGKDGQAAQPGDGLMVHPPLVLGHVDGAHLVSKALYHRGHQKADHQCRQQSQRHRRHQLHIKFHVSSAVYRARKPTFL